VVRSHSGKITVALTRVSQHDATTVRDRYGMNVSCEATIDADESISSDDMIVA